MNTERYVLLVLDNSQGKQQIRCGTSVPRRLNSNLYFLASDLVSREAERRTHRVSNCGKCYAVWHRIFACGEGFQCAHKLLPALGTTDYDSSLDVTWSVCDKATGLTALIRRLRVTETKRNAFKGGPFLRRLHKADATARRCSPKVDEAIRFRSYSMLQKLSNVVSINYLYGLLNE